MTYLYFLNFFFAISRLCGSSATFSKRHKSPKKFQYIYLKNLHRGPAQFNPVLFKDQLYWIVQSHKLKILL